MKNSRLGKGILWGLIVLFLLVGCSASDKIQGKWYGTSGDGVKHTVDLSEDKAVVTNDEESSTYELKQVAVGIKNGVRYYGITLDGDTFSVIFPEDNEEVAFMLSVEEGNYLEGRVVFALDTEDYPDYQEYYDKYITQE